MLSQGLFNADVLYYYGDDVPNFVFLREDVKDLGFGHDWDKCSEEALLTRLSVKNNRAIFPDGMSYRFRWYCPRKMPSTPRCCGKLRHWCRGTNRHRTPTGKSCRRRGPGLPPENDKEVSGLASRLWGKIDGTTIKENRYGKGKIVWGKDVNTVLTEMNVKPDFAFKSTQSSTSLDYIHRSTNDMEIYFIVNRFGRKEINDFEYHDLQSLPDRYEQVEALLPVTGKYLKLWDPVTGQSSQIMVYREEAGQTIIPLS